MLLLSKLITINFDNSTRRDIESFKEIVMLQSSVAI